MCSPWDPCFLIVLPPHLKTNSSLWGPTVVKPRDTKEEIVIESSFGDMVILDMYYDNCISHEVTKVVNWDRFVLVGFCSDQVSDKINIDLRIPDMPTKESEDE